MKKYLIIVLMAGFLAVGETHGKEEVYYCAEIDNNGFQYNKENGKYKRQGFFTDKFKMKLDTDSNRIDLAFDESKISYSICTTPHTLFPNFISCSGGGISNFNFNTNTGRFVYSRVSGYVLALNSPIYISYGKCDKF